jgi:hypothetical protein
MQMLLNGLKQLNSLSDQMTQKLSADGQGRAAPADASAEHVMAVAEDWLSGAPLHATHDAVGPAVDTYGADPAWGQEPLSETSTATSVDGMSSILSSAATTVAQLELESLHRDIRELGEGAVADALDQQAIEQAIEKKRQRRPAPAARSASATGSRKKGMRNKGAVQRRHGTDTQGRVQARVDARTRRGKQNEQPSSDAVNAGPTWEQLRAQTLREDAELSAFIADARQASQHETRRAEEWTEPVAGVDTAMHQLQGELQLMRALVTADVGVEHSRGGSSW